MTTLVTADRYDGGQKGNLPHWGRIRNTGRYKGVAAFATHAPPCIGTPQRSISGALRSPNNNRFIVGGDNMSPAPGTTGPQLLNRPTITVRRFVAGPGCRPRRCIIHRAGQSAHLRSDVRTTLRNRTVLQEELRLSLATPLSASGSGGTCRLTVTRTCQQLGGVGGSGILRYLPSGTDQAPAGRCGNSCFKRLVAICICAGLLVQPFLLRLLALLMTGRWAGDIRAGTRVRASSGTCSGSPPKPGRRPINRRNRRSAAAGA